MSTCLRSARSISCTNDALRTLTKIHKFVQEQSKRSYVSRFMRSQDDVAVIQQYSDDLRHALDLFGVRLGVDFQLEDRSNVVLFNSFVQRSSFSTSCTARPRSRKSTTPRSCRPCSATMRCTCASSAGLVPATSWRLSLRRLQELKALVRYVFAQYCTCVAVESDIDVGDCRRTARGRRLDGRSWP